MAKKTEDSISLDNVLPAIDRKDKDWWETLTPAQQKKFPAWLYMRYASNVKGNADLARYYLLAVNERVNKKFSDIRKHPKLQYLLMTSASPDMGKQFHQYLAPPKGGKTNSKRLKLLEQLFPNANDLELDVLAEVNTTKDIEEHLISLGWTDKEIKNALSTKDTDEE
jgi:hypothetical protein